MSELAPLAQPTGIFTQFIASQNEVIIVDEKGLSLSGDSFDVKLANGTPLFNVKGSTFSIRERKEVYDMENNHLFTIRKKAVSILGSRYLVKTPSDELLVEVKFSFAKFIGTKAYITFTSVSGKAEAFTMEGDWRSKKAEITDDATGAVVTRITRERSVKHYVADAQTYSVSVAPNMDMALAMAICIAFDEKNEEGK